MSGMVNFLKKLADAVDKIMYAIGSAGLIVCAGMCGANILMWWLFGRRIAVCDEISLFGLVWTTYIGMGVLFRSGGHCTMDFRAGSAGKSAYSSAHYYRYCHSCNLPADGLLFVEACLKVFHKTVSADQNPLLFCGCLSYMRLYTSHLPGYRRYCE